MRARYQHTPASNARAQLERAPAGLDGGPLRAPACRAYAVPARRANAVRVSSARVSHRLRRGELGKAGPAGGYVARRAANAPARAQSTLSASCHCTRAARVRAGGLRAVPCFFLARVASGPRSVLGSVWNRPGGRCCGNNKVGVLACCEHVLPHRCSCFVRIGRVGLCADRPQLTPVYYLMWQCFLQMETTTVGG